MQFENAGELEPSARLALAHRANAATVQLFEVRPGRTNLKLRIPFAVGTGVFVHHQGRMMILTAAHVLDSEYVQRYGLFVGHRELGWVDLGDFSFVRTASDGDRLRDDDLDNAIVLLPPEIAGQLRHGGVFEAVSLPCPDLTGDAARRVAYLIHGFPVDLTTTSAQGQHIEPTAISCLLPLHDESQGSWKTRFVESKLDFQYIPRMIVDLAGLGRQIPLPEPHGFSGCGVWKVILDGEASSRAEPEMILHGIVHRFNRELGILRATRLDLVCRMLVQDFPET